MKQLNLTHQVIPFPAPSDLAAQFMQRHRTLVDMIHLDAAHEYASVKADLALWAPLIREGGIMLGDDYLGHWVGVKRAVDEFASAVGVTVEVRGHKWLMRRPATAQSAWPQLPAKPKWKQRAMRKRGKQAGGGRRGSS
jgi:hypothetical protein